MKVLVIGGTRFIGRHLVPRLLGAGHQVCLFNRGQHASPAELKDVQVIIGDRQQPGQLADRLAGQEFDAAIDMVAYNAADIRTSVEALQGKVGHFLFISTRSVYKEKLVPAPIRETDRLEDDPVMAYGYHKAQAETQLMAAYQTSGFPATVLRLPAVYGPYDYQVREWYFIKRFLDNREQMLLPDYGWGVNQREYAGNVADQLAFLLTKQESVGQIYNSGHRHFQNFRDLVRLAGELFGREMELYGLPKEQIPWKVPLSEPGLYVLSTGKLEALGYREHYDLRTALKATIDYFTAHPVSGAWTFETRQNKRLFDYQLEDELIEKAVQLRGYTQDHD
jgi:nucleoside-diphosphate-sugar epimerase